MKYDMYMCLAKIRLGVQFILKAISRNCGQRFFRLYSIQPCSFCLKTLSSFCAKTLPFAGLNNSGFVDPKRFERKRTRRIGFVMRGSDSAGSNPSLGAFFALLFHERLEKYMYCVTKHRLNTLMRWVQELGNFSGKLTALGHKRFVVMIGRIFANFYRFLDFVVIEYGGGKVNGETLETKSAVNFPLKCPSSWISQQMYLHKLFV